MRSRREQMQAYRFVIRRIVAAVLSGEPESLDRPMRRLGISLFVSTMIGVVVFAGFGVYGFLANPGGELENSSIVIERGTGTTYVYIDDKLHPVRNITSARLIVGGAANPRTVSPSSLVDTPRGVTLGIEHAPVALPTPGDLLGLPWRLCSVPPAGAQTEPTTTVVIDRGLGGNASLAGERALYVTTGEHNYLLWNDRRLRIPDPSAVVALRLPTRAVLVGQPLINTVTAGPDLAPPRVDGAGDESDRELGGGPAEVGQVFEASGEHFVLTRDGLAEIGEVSWTLLAADGVSATPISASEAGAALAGSGLEALEPPGFPQVLPQPHPQAAGNPTVCTAYVGDEVAGPLGTRIEVFDSTPEELSTGADALDVAQTDRDSVSVADRVVIAGGRGALVQAVPHTGAAAPGDTVYLVTDQGIKYPLGGAGGDGEAKAALGYGEVDPVPIPTDLLAMIPTGPTLSQEAALRPVLPSATSAN